MTSETPGRGERDDEPRYGERVASDREAAGRVSGSQAPGYGEYAPPGWVSPVPPVEKLEPQDLEPTRQVATVASRPGSPRGYDAPPPTGAPVPGAPPAPVRPRSFNRFATVLLLAFGLYNVVSSALTASSFAPDLLAQLNSIGYPSSKFTSTAGLQHVATVGAFAGIVVFFVVAVWSLRRLRAGKNSWVPLLVAGVVVNVVTGLFVVGVIFNDPSFAAYMASSAG